MVSCILGGNSVHDRCLTAGRYLGVLEAVPFVACSVGEVNIGEELTVCFVKEDDADSSLSHQLTSHFETKDRSAAFVGVRSKRPQVKMSSCTLVKTCSCSTLMTLLIL